jgi:hypothetical protein
MTAGNQIQRNPLIEIWQQLCADIRDIAEGDCQWAAADLDHQFEDQRIRIRYTVRPLLPQNGQGEGPDGGGMMK